MADNKPNFALEKSRMLLDTEVLKLNIKKFEFRKLELEDERQRLDLNIAATNDAIHSLEQKINSLGGN